MLRGTSDPQNEMQLSQTYYVLVLLAIFLLYLAQPTMSHCIPCGSECDQCKHGVVTTRLCGIPECRKGPGEICGGPSKNWGICGDGLTCNCSQCSGCSLDTNECFTNMNCFPMRSKSRRSDFLNRLSQSL
ncbi:neuroparsin-A isoform X2 [Cephus cinctus]|uniref:Neuroparsin-A isoform X2 n=1 Tax=Cephus cinctus TaxID=211228 RepID=A0AAJ7BJK2_CEPCN|nr:neuroparsin-A isoform X2 [Cephus cinctus]